MRKTEHEKFGHIKDGKIKRGTRIKFEFASIKVTESMNRTPYQIEKEIKAIVNEYTIIPKKPDIVTQITQEKEVVIMNMSVNSDEERLATRKVLERGYKSLKDYFEHNQPMFEDNQSTISMSVPLSLKQDEQMIQEEVKKIMANTPPNEIVEYLPKIKRMTRFWTRTKVYDRKVEVDKKALYKALNGFKKSGVKSIHFEHYMYMRIAMKKMNEQ